MKTWWWLISLIFFGCNLQPQPIRYGEDACAHCRMVIADEKFGSELITQKGKIYKFDSIECLAAYLRSGVLGEKQVHSTWVTDFNRPGQWISTAAAQFLQSPNVPSPMGMYLSAYAGAADADRMKTLFDGEVLNWQQVLTRVNSAHANR